MLRSKILVSVLILLCQWAVPVLADGKQPPNILLITCDNHGYGDLPIYNEKSEIRAPHLTRLASLGAKLTSFYTASPTCTVSRSFRDRTSQ